MLNSRIVMWSPKTSPPVIFAPVERLSPIPILLPVSVIQVEVCKTAYGPILLVFPTTIVP